MTNEKELSDILETIKTKIHDLPEHIDYMGRIDKKTVLNLLNKKFKSENLTERIMELEKEICPLREQVVDQREKISRLKTKLEEQMPTLDMMKLEKEITRLKADYSRLDEIKKRYVRLLNKRNKEISRLSATLESIEKSSGRFKWKGYWQDKVRTKAWKLLEEWRGEHCIYEECVMNPCPKCKRFYDHFAEILKDSPSGGKGA